jgi:putative OPT family oligopeptide transporter
MQLLGVTSTALVIAPILQVLFEAYGLGDVLPRPEMDPAEALRAPQATLMASVALGVFEQDLPWSMILIGGGIAVIIIVVDVILKMRGSSIRTPVLAVAVGIYLPIDLSVPIAVGAVSVWIARCVFKRRHTHQEHAIECADRTAVLFASGLIAGEALIGVLLGAC